MTDHAPAITELPPMPPYLYGRECSPNEKVWSKEAMDAYAAEAVKLEREACAVACEWEPIAFGENKRCAAAIRARATMPG